MSGLLARYQSLPRAGRWAVIGLAVVVAYFAAVEPAITMYNGIASEADKRAARLASYAKERAARSNAETTIASGVARYGIVEYPGDPEQRSVAFNKQISEIMTKHGLKEDSTTRTAALGAGPLLGAVGSDKRVERLVKELTFSATPEKVVAVVNDLEASPIIAAVSKVQIRVPGESERDGRNVRASVAVEAWVVVPKGRGR